MMFSDKVTYQQTHNHLPETLELAKFLKAVKYGTRTGKEKQVLKYRAEYETLRSKGLNHDEVKAVMKKNGTHRLKTTLPLVAVSSICEGARREENISQLTGWVTLDIDEQDNPGVDAEFLRDEAAKIVYVAFSAISTGGRGVFLLMKVKDPEKQSEYIDQLRVDFANRGIILDKTKGKNPVDARFYSYDPNAIIKSSFEVYNRLPIPKPARKKRLPALQPAGNAFEAAMNFAKKKGYTFTHGSDMHYSIFHLCSFLNWIGIPKDEAEEWIDKNLLPLRVIKTNCIDDPYKKYRSDFGAGRLIDRGTKPQWQGKAPKNRVNTIQGEISAPYGHNPYTGEIFDSRGYPGDWDNINLN